MLAGSFSMSAAAVPDPKLPFEMTAPENVSQTSTVEKKTNAVFAVSVRSPSDYVSLSGSQYLFLLLWLL